MDLVPENEIVRALLATASVAAVLGHKEITTQMVRWATWVLQAEARLRSAEQLMISATRAPGP